MIDLRLRVRVSQEELKAKRGKILGPADYNLLLTGPALIRMPDNRPLAVYLPGVLRGEVDGEGVYDILHSLGSITTDSRGLASGTRGAYTRHGQARNAVEPTHHPRRYYRRISSIVAGAIDPTGLQKVCRLTSWTGSHLPQWQALQPLLQAVARQQAKYVPDRAAVQQAVADSSHPAWVIPGTPFSTVTVNNTYPTGTHTDKGDLDEGFSTITVLRRGEYTGGHLVFPEYRVAVDLQHGDLLLMDAHQWHGNTALVCHCGREPNGYCQQCGAERISVVSYFRTKIAQCGSPDEELRRASNKELTT